MPLPDFNIFSLQPSSSPTKRLCFCTIIKNLTSSPKWVLVPKHGTTIGPGQQYVFIGSISTWLQRRSFYVRDAFLNDIVEGRLSVLQTPNVHLYNEAGPTTKILAINNDGSVLSLANPCWA